MFDIPNNQLLMRQAVKWGVTYWDTANSYEGGNSEQGIGKYFAQYPEDRKKIFLVTKSTAWTKAGMTEHLELSLERMQHRHGRPVLRPRHPQLSTMDTDMRQWGGEGQVPGQDPPLRLQHSQQHGAVPARGAPGSAGSTAS